jgi:hypothetical protein
LSFQITARRASPARHRMRTHSARVTNARCTINSQARGEGTSPHTRRPLASTHAQHTARRPRHMWRTR